MAWQRLWCKLQTGDSPVAPLGYNDLPALYRAADTYSLSQQKVFFRLLASQLIFFLLATIISVVGSGFASLAIVQAVSLFSALGCAAYLFALKPDRHWYAARAVAESVKTVTWRFVTRAEPFAVDDTTSKARFGEVLKEIVSQNQDVARRFSTDLDGMQLTQRMEELRASNFETRKAGYLGGRVDEQQNWYARKNKMNNCRVKRAFTALIGFLAIAGVFAISRVHFLHASVWPTDVFVTLAASVLTWMQSKRYSELAAAYSLAAVEISNIRLQGIGVQDDPEAWSSFVGDAENAFSREHTQWVARKDA